MEQLLRAKYAKLPPQIVIPVGSHPVEFVLARKQHLFPEARVLYFLFGHEAAQPVPDATGVILDLNLVPTLELAMAQNPGTKRVLLITGTSAADKVGVPELISKAAEAFQHQHRPIDVITLPSMSFYEARRYVAQLAQDTVAVIVWYYSDSKGERFVPAGVVPDFSRACNRPLYAGWESDVGRGIVGGSAISLSAIGDQLALLAGRILSGEAPGQIPPVRGEFQHYVFDYQQLRRWGIPMDQLPAGSIVLNREYTTWALYKWYIFGTIVLILAAAGLVTYLVRLVASRRRTEQRLENRGEFEALTAQLSAAFINLPAELVDVEIERGFRHLLDFFHIDRISVFEVTDTSLLRLQHLCSSPCMASPPPKLDLTQMPEVLSLLTEGKPIVVSTAQELPAHESALKEFVQRMGVASIATFPLRADGRLFGTMTFSSYYRPVAWTPELTGSLRTIADIFGNALMRKRTEGSLMASEHFKTSILSSLSNPVAVLDPAGNIIAVNERWMEFVHTGGDPGKLEVGKNYLEAIRNLVPNSDDFLQGIESVCNGARDFFDTEYAIPIGSETLYFDMSVSPFKGPTGGAVVIHRDITERKRTDESIRELSGRLIHAQEDERSRIARELHDDINQQLALLGIEIQRVEEDLPETNAPLRARLEEIWKKTHEASQDVQRISHQLHSSKLEHLGLPAALKGLLQEFTRLHQVRGETQFRDIPTPLDREVSLTLFRVAQEALRNAGKHSGAKNIRIELIGETAGLLLRISDDGVGFDPKVNPRYGLGMISMEERLHLVKGRLSVWSRVGVGTQVEARVPLTAQPAAECKGSIAGPPLRSWRNDELPNCIQFSACS
jgi:signal transduction histidine kinase